MNNSGFAGRIISLVFILAVMLLGSAVWFFWKDYFLPPKDLTADYQEVDVFVRDFLYKSGLTDADVLERYGREIKKDGFLWVEYFMRIECSAKCPAQKLIPALKKNIKQVKGGFVREKRDKKDIAVDVGKNGRVFFKILLTDTSALPAKKKVSIIIDDLGYRTDILEKFFNLGVPLTYAILPGEVHTKRIAQMLDSLGKEYILHLPLEPEGYPDINPGKQALLLSMSREELFKKADSVFAWLPDVKGFNFHMGSAFSADAEKMDDLLSFAEERGLFVVDSRTSLNSQVRKAAKKKNIDVLYNDIFLDTEKDMESIQDQLRQCLRIAKRKEYCIAIGHVHSTNLPEAILSVTDEFNKEGIKFVLISELLAENRRGDADTGN